MKFKLDENLPLEVEAELKAHGHDAETVVDEGLVGAPDAVLAERAGLEQRALMTLDKGFADVRAYPPDRFAGLVVLRPATSGRLAVLALVRQWLPTILNIDVRGQLLVVNERGVRIRRSAG